MPAAEPMVSGAKGTIYEARGRRFQVSTEPEVSSVAALVLGLNWRLLGSICIPGPPSRPTKTTLQAHAKNVIRTANPLSYALARGRPAHKD
jgi:DNA-binding IclR family transcriptional regulator